MALELEAETVLRPLFLAAAAGGGDGEMTGREAAPFFLATEMGQPVDPMIWGDEKRMKRELLVWAKAVASMAASNSTSSSPSRSMRRRGK